jgi:hypothetical protein
MSLLLVIQKRILVIKLLPHLSTSQKERKLPDDSEEPSNKQPLAVNRISVNRLSEIAVHATATESPFATLFICGSYVGIHHGLSF